MLRLKEIERTRFTTRRIRKLHTVLSHKRTGLQLLQQSHSLKSKIGVSHQRLANVMTREAFLFKQDNLAAFARKDAGDCAASWPAAHNNNVVFIDLFHGF